MTATEITVEDLHARKNKGEVIFLLDVRTEPEFVAGRLAFTDALIPYDALPFYLDRLPDRKTLIACFCRSGNRSHFAMQFLQAQGFSRAVNVRGGILAWHRAGFEIVSGPNGGE